MATDTKIFEDAYKKRIEVAEDNETIKELFNFFVDNFKDFDIESLVIDSSIRKEALKFIIDLGNNIKSEVLTYKDMARDNYIICTLWLKDELMIADVMPIFEYRDMIVKIQNKIKQL